MTHRGDHSGARELSCTGCGHANRGRRAKRQENPRLSLRSRRQGYGDHTKAGHFRLRTPLFPDHGAEATPDPFSGRSADAPICIMGVFRDRPKKGRTSRPGGRTTLCRFPKAESRISHAPKCFFRERRKLDDDMELPELRYRDKLKGRSMPFLRYILYPSGGIRRWDIPYLKSTSAL